MNERAKARSAATAGGRTILHVDMDAFFASVEVLDNPELRGRPVLVGGRGRRAVVAAASYEAREHGCRSAQPMSVALRRCPGAVVVAPRHDRYVECSRQIFEIFVRFTPLVEGLSIDEAFLDLTGTRRLLGNPEAVAEAIRASVHAEVGLTCSVGVAVNKFVAKVASDHNKPDGVTVVPAGEERRFLAPLPIRAIWGVGPRTAEILARLGITRVGELARFGEHSAGREALSHALGDQGTHLHRLSCGVDTEGGVDRPVTQGRGVKQISHEDTFEDDLVGVVEVRRSLLHQATRVADRLVRRGLRARTVAIKLRDAGFNTETRSCTLAEPTDQAYAIYRSACALLERLQVEGRRFRLTGVAAADLRDQADLPSVGTQLDLLPEPEEVSEARGRAEALQGVLSAVRERFGREALYPGAAGRRRPGSPPKREG